LYFFRFGDNYFVLSLSENNKRNKNVLKTCVVLCGGNGNRNTMGSIGISTTIIIEHNEAHNGISSNDFSKWNGS
jgi:hypothetical protein